jgi:hypothetical protein
MGIQAGTAAAWRVHARGPVRVRVPVRVHVGRSQKTTYAHSAGVFEAGVAASTAASPETSESALTRGTAAGAIAMCYCGMRHTYRGPSCVL